MPERYTTSMAVAWEYVLNATQRGLTATAGLNEYRAGGGKIRTSDWYYLYRGAQDSAYAQELSARLPDYLYIDRGAYMWTPVPYQEDYVAKVKVTAWDSEGNVYPSFWRTVERSSNTTRAQWKIDIADYVEHDRSIPDLTDVYIEEIQFFTHEPWGTGAPEG